MAHPADSVPVPAVPQAPVFLSRLIGKHASDQVRVLVHVHGTGGTGEDGFDAIAASVAEAFDHDVLLIAPTFDVPYHFLLPAADEALLHHLRQMAKQLPLHDRMLLTGFSGGAQFAHRFALQHPEHVHACACQSAGSWTTPDGTFIGMMADEGWLDRPGWDKATIRDSANAPAADDWQHIRWLAGVGRRDHPARVDSARRFHEELLAGGGHSCFHDWDAAHDLTADACAQLMTFLAAASRASSGPRRITD